MIIATPTEHDGKINFTTSDNVGKIIVTPTENDGKILATSAEGKIFGTTAENDGTTTLNIAGLLVLLLRMNARLLLIQLQRMMAR